MSISRLSIRQEIAKLNRLDPIRADYALIERTYRRLTDGLHIVVGLTGGKEIFFRVRKNMDHKPIHVDELSAPPAQFVIGYQRCNPPGVPMFYASSTRLGALLETRAASGDRVYLSQWIGKEQMPVNRVFDTPEMQNIPSANTATIHGPHDDLIITHFDTLFTKRIHSDFSDDYKFTSSIAQQLTTLFPSNEEHKIHDDGFISLKFASVFDIERTHNTAMHSAFAKERLELLHVMECEVINGPEGRISVRVSDNAVDLDGDIIKWSGDPNLIPSFRRERKSVPFRFDGTKWRLELHNGDVTESYIEALLIE